MRARFNARVVATGVVALTMAAGTFAAAQVPNASAAATGLSGAYIARARGYDAVAWNPANLGMPGNPSFSFSALALSASSGLDPISLSDVAPFSGKVLPSAQREEWLQAITVKGGENGRVDGGLTAIALSAGPLAFSVSGTIAGSTKLSPDAFEALMFGNAGRTGTPKDLTLAGSTVHMGAFTTGAVSYGIGGGKEGGHHFALGVTGKYVLGNAVAIAQDQGSTAGANSVTVNFPAVYSRPDSDVVAGSGIGMDVGLAWSGDRLRFGAAVQNVINTFAWDESKLRSKTALALFDAGTDTMSFVETPYAAAPASLRGLVAADKFKPVVSAGIAYELGSHATFSADGRQQVGDGIAIGPKTQVAGGLELRVIPLLRLRGGGAYLTGGWGVSGGASLALGPVDIGVGAALRHVNGGQEPAVTINVLSFR